MAVRFRFSFHFDKLESEISHPVIVTSGGHIGAALARAWKILRCNKVYKSIPKLCPNNIGIEKIPLHDGSIFEGLQPPPTRM